MAALQADVDVVLVVVDVVALVIIRHVHAELIQEVTAEQLMRNVRRPVITVHLVVVYVMQKAEALLFSRKACRESSALHTSHSFKAAAFRRPRRAARMMRYEEC